MFSSKTDVEDEQNEVEIYGILSHYKDLSERSKPAHVEIIFPDPTYKHVLGPIDLLERLGEEVDEPPIGIPLTPKVRTKIEKRENE